MTFLQAISEITADFPLRILDYGVLGIVCVIMYYFIKFLIVEHKKAVGEMVTILKDTILNNEDECEKRIKSYESQSEMRIKDIKDVFMDQVKDLKEDIRVTKNETRQWKEEDKGKVFSNMEMQNELMIETRKDIKVLAKSISDMAQKLAS